MALWVRLILLVLLAALPVFLIQVVHEIGSREDRRQRLLDNAQFQAGLAAGRQDRLVEGARLLLTATSRLGPVIHRDSQACDRELQEIVAKIPELTAMAVLTPAGDRWCVSRAGSRPINIGDRPYFQATLKTRSFQSSGYIVGRQTGAGSVAFTYPALGPSGGVESVLFLAYRTDTLSRTLQESSLPEGGFVALLDEDGTVAARWPDPENWIGKSLRASAAVPLILTQRRGAIQIKAEWAGNGEYAIGFAPMQPPTSLTALVGLPLDSALRESQSLFWNELAWTFVVFALAAFIAIIGAHVSVLRPIRSLNASVDALARGDFRGARSGHFGGSKELRSVADHVEKMARALEARQSQLIEALHQKDLLLREVNHRVKNSLQLVASLFALQRSHIKDPEARRQFDHAGRRINTVAQIHQRLYQDENVDRVMFDTFLRELCDDLNNAVGQNQRLVFSADAPCPLPTGQVIPAALIVNELITNSFKHSYSPEAPGEIHVACKRNGKLLSVSVSDDGVPLPDDFDPGKSGGLGMKMVAALIKQLRAEFEVIRSAKGKTFVIQIPLEE